MVRLKKLLAALFVALLSFAPTNPLASPLPGMMPMVGGVVLEAFSFTYIQTVDGNATTCASTAVSMGADAWNRYLVVGIVQNNTNNTATVTLDGVTASTTPILTVNFSANGTGRFFGYHHPGGATATVAVSTTGADGISCSYWRLTGCSVCNTGTNPLTVANDEQSDSALTGNAYSVSLTTPASGVGISQVLFKSATAVRTTTWTNMTENSDTTVDSGIFLSQSSARTTTAATTTVTATASGTVQAGYGMLAISFGP
jgi:hypothetical protein